MLIIFIGDEIMSSRKNKKNSFPADSRFAGSGNHANSAEFVPLPIDDTEDGDFLDSLDSVYDNIPNYRGDKFKDV